MHRLRNKAEAEGGRLLRVLLLRLSALSANSGGTLRRIGRSLLLRVARAISDLRHTHSNDYVALQKTTLKESRTSECPRSWQLDERFMSMC